LSFAGDITRTFWSFFSGHSVRNKICPKLEPTAMGEFMRPGVPDCNCDNQWLFPTTLTTQYYNIAAVLSVTALSRSQACACGTVCQPLWHHSHHC